MSPVYIKTRLGKTGKRFVVYYRRGGRAFPEEYAGSFRTAKEARIRRDLVAGELAAGRDPRLLIEAARRPAVPPAGLADRWDAFIGSRLDVGAKTVAVFASARDRWLPLLGAATAPQTVTVDDVIAGVAALADELTPGTVKQYLSGLAQMLDFCEVQPNPARSPRVKLPRREPVEKQIPTTAAWLDIREQTRRRSLLALRLMEACALRVGEACGLEVGDVDFVEGMAHVRRSATKTTSGRRWLPVPAVLLDEALALIPPDDRQAHRPLLAVAGNRVYQDLQAACLAAGRPPLGTHAFRHRRISLWLRHGIDPVQVARWAGHSRSSMSLDVYGHVVLDPSEDEWRGFWLDAYEAAGRQSGAARVRHGDADA